MNDFDTVWQLFAFVVIGGVGPLLYASLEKGFKGKEKASKGSVFLLSWFALAVIVEALLFGFVRELRILDWLGFEGGYDGFGGACLLLGVTHALLTFVYCYVIKEVNFKQAFLTKRDYMFFGLLFPPLLMPAFVGHLQENTFIHDSVRQVEWEDEEQVYQVFAYENLYQGPMYGTFGTLIRLAKECTPEAYRDIDIFAPVAFRQYIDATWHRGLEYKKLNRKRLIRVCFENPDGLSWELYKERFVEKDPNKSTSFIRAISVDVLYDPESRITKVGR